MTSSHFKAQAEISGSPALRLEIARQETNTPLLIPVLIRSLSTRGVTLTMTNPGDIPDWDRYRGEACVLRVEDPEGGQPLKIKAQITWTRFGGTGQPPLSLGLQLIKPPGNAISRLSNLLPHTSQDMKRLWDRYDQVRKSPANSEWVQYCYIAGIGLLLGGLVLQFASSPVYKVCGWGLWLLGSLGIAGKVIRPFWPHQPSIDRIGKSL
jgi:preprotein translocase subunit Sss1